MTPCVTPLPLESLVAYWAGDLPADESDALEAHLFQCEACTVEAARIAAITETLRASVPPVVSPERLVSLRAGGLVIEDNFFVPGQRGVVWFGDKDLLIHHLGGLRLGDGARVSLMVRVEETGEILAEVQEAPYDAEGGEVLIACQRHFVAFPPNIVFEVTATSRTGAAQTERYTVEHRR